MGYIIFLNKAPIAWKSKKQNTVALLSTEAEFYVLTEATTTLLYIYDILIFMEIEVKLPMKLFIDNTGAIFLANNWSTTNRTKHMDVKYYFVRELIEEGKIEVTFV